MNINIFPPAPITSSSIASASIISASVAPVINFNYAELSRNFLEKYFMSNSLGIHFIYDYYAPEFSSSIYIHKFNDDRIYETVGYSNFKTKLIELGINLIQYRNINFASQPLGENYLFVSSTGTGNINGSDYHIEMSFILKIESDIKIHNQIFHIFI